MFFNHKLKIFFITFSFIFMPLSVFAKKAPESFADLAKTLSPSVVNISTTTIIEDRKNNLPAFPPGSPFEEFFKQFQDPNQGKRRAQSLGSGFIIDKKGFIITNNHVIESSSDGRRSTPPPSTAARWRRASFSTRAPTPTRPPPTAAPL